MQRGWGGGMEERERERVSVVMKREGIWGDSFGLSRIKGRTLRREIRGWEGESGRVFFLSTSNFFFIFKGIYSNENKFKN